MCTSSAPTLALAPIPQYYSLKIKGFIFGLTLQCTYLIDCYDMELYSMKSYWGLWLWLSW